MSLLDLPTETLASILALLPVDALLSCAQTSTRLRHLATVDSLWAPHYLSFWTCEGPEDARLKQWRQQKWRRGLDRLVMSHFPESETPERVLPKGFWQGEDEAEAEAEAEAGDQDDQPLHLFQRFLARLKLDQATLNLILTQSQATHGFARRGADHAEERQEGIKDVLHALIRAQQLPPSSPADYMRNIDPNHIDVQDALELRLRPRRSSSHHLSLLHYARELLEHVQRRRAIEGMVRLDRMSERDYSALQARQSVASEKEGGKAHLFRVTPARGREYEQAMSVLDVFVGGEPGEVEKELDLLAAACYVHLEETRTVALDTIRDDGQDTESELRRKALGIVNVMRSRGFKGASMRHYHRLSNSFLHATFSRKDRSSLPLTLVTIFCAIASRLGIPAVPVNAPGKVTALVSWPPLSTEEVAKPYNLDTSSSVVRFYCDVYDRGDISDAGAQPSFPSVTPASMVLRSTRNMMNSIRFAMHGELDPAEPDDDEASTVDEDDPTSSRQGRDAEEDVRCPRSVSLFNAFSETSDLQLLSLKRSTPFPTSLRSSDGHACQLACIYATICATVYLEGKDEGEQRRITVLHQLVDSVRQSFLLDARLHCDALRDIGILDSAEGRRAADMLSVVSRLDDQPPTPKASSASTSGTFSTTPEMRKPAYKMGTIFLHKAYHYRAIVTGWDPTCLASEEWIRANGVHLLPHGGKDQPFYDAMVEDGSTRYVAELNVVRLEPHEVAPKGIEGLLGMRKLGKFFRCWGPNEDGRLTLTELAKAIYPEDA